MLLNSFKHPSSPTPFRKSSSLNVIEHQRENRARQETFRSDHPLVSGRTGGRGGTEFGIPSETMKRKRGALVTMGFLGMPELEIP
jgi:hypothetical protein